MGRCPWGHVPTGTLSLGSRRSHWRRLHLGPWESSVTIVRTCPTSGERVRPPGSPGHSGLTRDRCSLTLRCLLFVFEFALYRSSVLASQRTWRQSPTIHSPPSSLGLHHNSPCKLAAAGPTMEVPLCRLPFREVRACLSLTSCWGFRRMTSNRHGH